MAKERTAAPDPHLAAKLKLTAELFEAGVVLQRERLRRENPTLDPAEIEALVEAWLGQYRVPKHCVVVEWPRS